MTNGTGAPSGAADVVARPWWFELGSVVPRSVTFAARATRPAATSGVPSLALNPLSWATVAVDELAISSVYLATRRRAEQLTDERLEAAAHAVDLLGAAGLLDDPAGLYAAPEAPRDVRLTDRQRGGLHFEHVSFDSANPAPEGLLALTDWDALANRRAHAYLLRHGDRPRPWVLVVHGHRMGESRDIRFLGSRSLHTGLGVDVAHLVLPMHGPRGRVDPHAFPGADPVANLLGVTQSVSDARTLLRWIRADSDRPVGVFGLSLGGLVAGLLAAHEPDLSAVVVGVPLSDIASMLAETVRSRWGDAALEHAHFLDPAPTQLSGLASPLTFPAAVPVDRLAMYAAVGDRLVTAQQAAALWRHWGRPAIQWLQGGHILNNMSTSRRFVARALAAGGVTER